MRSGIIHCLLNPCLQRAPIVHKLQSKYESGRPSHAHFQIDSDVPKLVAPTNLSILTCNVCFSFLSANKFICRSHLLFSLRLFGPSVLFMRCLFALALLLVGSSIVNAVCVCGDSLDGCCLSPMKRIWANKVCIRSLALPSGAKEKHKKNSTIELRRHWLPGCRSPGASFVCRKRFWPPVVWFSRKPVTFSMLVFCFTAYHRIVWRLSAAPERRAADILACCVPLHVSPSLSPRNVYLIFTAESIRRQ